MRRQQATKVHSIHVIILPVCVTTTTVSNVITARAIIYIFKLARVYTLVCCCAAHNHVAAAAQINSLKGDN